MRASFWAKARVTGSGTRYLLCRVEVLAQGPRFAEVDVLGLVAVGRVVVDQDADYPWERARHLDLLGAEQRHAIEPEVAGRDRGELRIQVGGGREDAAHDLVRDQLVSLHQLRHQLT